MGKGTQVSRPPRASAQGFSRRDLNQGGVTPGLAFGSAVAATLVPGAAATADPLSLALTFAALLVVLGYVAWGLPRLADAAGLAISAVLLAGLGGLAWWVEAPLGWACALVAAAVAFGHVGVAAGRVHRPSAAGPLPRAVPPAAPGKPPAAARAAGAKPEWQTLGRYQIEKEVGRGAMGAVYLGHDPKIGRPVAIKTMALTQEFAGGELSEARQRFFREAETAGRLQHPDIVTIFDAGEERDLAFIAMELLKGDNLQVHTQPGRLLPVVAVLATVARVADALAYAHSQGVVHRDIKPANVMLDLANDVVKVTDFGIARITDSNRTRTGMVLGTPSFMSPEQLAGRRVDGRSDLYSLGVMLYQLLTGRLPHRSDSMATLMHMIANEVADDVRLHRPELPESLARVLAQVLEKKPEARYASGQQLAADLRAIAHGLAESGVLVPLPTAPADPPDSSGFAATVKMDRADPGHNSGS